MVKRRWLTSAVKPVTVLRGVLVPPPGRSDPREQDWERRRSALGKQGDSGKRWRSGGGVCVCVSLYVNRNDELCLMWAMSSWSDQKKKKRRRRRGGFPASPERTARVRSPGDRMAPGLCRRPRDRTGLCLCRGSSYRR